MALRIVSRPLALALCALLASAARSDEMRFDSAADWSQWQMPHGLVQIAEDGRLRLVKYRKGIDAVADAHLFSHPTQQRGEASGGIWMVGSNPDSAPNVIDGDPATFWQPDPKAQLEDWSIDIDLGRAVLAEEIVLTFPDQEGARPFEQFTVYITTGARIKATEDIFGYTPAFRTTRPNRETTILIPLEYANTDSTLRLDSGLNPDADRYQVIQYISIIADGKNEGAALAEIEVKAVGDNVSLGTQQRGTFTNGTVVGTPENLFDADLNTFSIVTSGHEAEGGTGFSWKSAGTWWSVDLGATFFIDDLFVYYQNRGEGVSSFIWFYSSSGPGHRILYSDGRRSIGSELPVDQALDFDELVTHINPRVDGLFQIRYLFQPRKIRYLFWHGTTSLDWRESRSLEMMLFSPGHPAKVVLRSNFIDLAETSGDGRPKVIKHLAWDADIPPGARLQLRSRTGNQLQQILTFYDKKNDEVTEAKYNSLPNVLKGAVDTSLVGGEDWDEWSNVYQFSGEPFLSQSPRRYAQLELILATEDPQVAPVVNSLSIAFEDALLQGARGRIAPRSTRPNEDTRFTYVLFPTSDDQDEGFDRLRFALPAASEDVAVRVGGREIEPKALSHASDSLLIDLPMAVRTDSVEVSFTTRVVHNATVFGLDLGSSAHPDLWHSVEPAERRANIVMLPALTGSRQLIDALELSSRVLTPNGDGVNDQVEIRFVSFKVEGRMPQGRIFDLAGRLIAELPAPAISGRAHTFAWSGLGRDGALVRPGAYLCRIELGADAGEDTVLRTIAVAY
ncbi:MAG: hypothetical protein VX293_12055 [Candidatus Latescibacterota bacterium]|nr:hypothetical protein [Candidatus Latescibacterota bacterium]